MITVDSSQLSVGSRKAFASRTLRLSSFDARGAEHYWLLTTAYCLLPLIVLVSGA